MLLGIAGCGLFRSDAPGNEARPTDEPPGIITTVPDITEPEDDFIPDGPVISTEDLAEALREKYADVESVVFLESLWNVPKNQEFYMDFQFDLIEDTEYGNFTEIFAVYADAELTEGVWGSWEIVTHEDDPSIPEGHNRVYARPGRNAAGRVWGSYYDLITRQKIDLDGAGEYYLHEQEEFSSWGFLRHYFLAMHIDPVTAETLEKPLVTIFTVENQLDAPQSEFFVTEDGKAAFRWNEVPGADYYVIVNIDEFGTIWPIDKTTGTSWVHPHREDAVTMNSAFAIMFATEDDILSLPDDFEPSEARIKKYSVIAVNSEVHSSLGTIHRGEEMAARLPYAVALNTVRQDSAETGGNSRFIPAVGLLPTHRAISMADGATVRRPMIYDFSFAEIKTDRWLYYDGYDSNDEMVNPRFEDHINLHINFIIEGTIFSGTMVVTDVDMNTAMTELEAFRRLIDDSAARGGGSTETDVEKGRKSDDSKTSRDAPGEVSDRRGDRIFANTALSEFLAINLLAANEMIDLSGFSESADWDYLVEAFFEAMYQNPLVLHVDSIFSTPGTNLLMVDYRETKREIHRQQVALLNIVPRIVAEIITPGMTDLDKSFAINRYLIENSEYDWEALREAERNDFQFVDDRFNNSFNAYGILINKVGVCAGYADAFKLLADEAGLEAIVVTGYLEGILPHAWNRVNIDGHWHTVDVTNNANEYLLNAFMNLPDSAAGRLLIEDNMFMMSGFINKYRSTDNTSEYYTATGRFFDTTEIAAELAEQIRRNGSITLRTIYDLDDDEFYDIAIEVMEILGIREIFGFFTLGVIWMSVSA